MSETLNEHKWDIETPTARDAESILRMRAQSWLDTYIRPGDSDLNDALQTAVDAFGTEENIEKSRVRIEKTAFDPESYMKVAKDSHGEVIGLIIGRIDDEKQYLSTLEVDKWFHGTGLAQRLVDGFFEKCDETRPIELNVIEDNLRAQAFYTKLGFVIVPESLRPYSGSEEVLRSMNQVTMIKPAGVK